MSEENLKFWSTLKRGNLACGNDEKILAMNKKRQEGIKLLLRSCVTCTQSKLSSSNFILTLPSQIRPDLRGDLLCSILQIKKYKYCSSHDSCYVISQTSSLGHYNRDVTKEWTCSFPLSIFLVAC